ncbi:MAG: amidase [Bdellovibrio sp. CG10_big_fil_rev_8_21_14_0_10_47_8]|nr:MAG: amidase [Bdellovibrio sp. CG10_big_fil_rev_8_21_14_0_10_47_8]
MFELSGLELGKRIRQGEWNIAEVVETHIRKIQEVNPKINAVVEDCFEDARTEAHEKDRELSNLNPQEREKLPLYFGVPFTIKEMISVRGKKSTMGSIHHRDRVMTEDATSLARIRKTGAILLGTTNVPEVGFWFECDNVVYGKASNPYDITRTPGGSSGGEGAIIGAGASPFGVGSDIGGSIRMPAAFCGIFGHKPSEKIIPMTGHFPVYRENIHEIHKANYPFTVMGPLAKRCEDMNFLMSRLVGPDGIDPEVKTDFQLLPLLQRPEQIKVWTLPSPQIHGASMTEPDLVESVINAGRYLHEMGTSVQEANEKLLTRSLDIWLGRAFSIEGRDFPEYLSNGEKLSIGQEFLRLILGKRKYTAPALLTALLDNTADERKHLQEFLGNLDQLKARLTAALGDNGVLIMPVHPRKAPKHHSTYLRPFDFAYTGVFNALGFPATSVPMGLSSEGLPLSVQVIAAENQDHLCLSVARWLEQGFGGWQPPRDPVQ